MSIAIVSFLLFVLPLKIYLCHDLWTTSKREYTSSLNPRKRKRRNIISLITHKEPQLESFQTLFHFTLNSICIELPLYHLHTCSHMM
ncbi:hypothetical protein BDZ91DRAFT_711628 [Kalaharituber pfeilii]|nr:hypothetical protein BDZ91DRAFT_711628 [Kalaharituber pfeilii]